MVFKLTRPEIELKYTSHVSDIYKIYHMLTLSQMQLTHLYIFATKAMQGHVERITQHRMTPQYNQIRTQQCERCARYCPVGLKNGSEYECGSGLQSSTRLQCLADSTLPPDSW